ncbi:hypothetical protein ACLMJK_001169 [Lecanora helva]
MKTPYYSGDFTVAQHSDIHDDDQLRERMLEHRLANRDDVREIYVVTALPFSERLRGSDIGRDLVKRVSKPSKTDLSWAMHWAIQVGDQFFELQRGYPDPLRTGLRMSEWDQQKKDQIHQRYRQGTTAMSDDEIKAVGERYFSRLERIDINTYDVWCNNCHLAVDGMLRDIGGLWYYRRKLESLQDMVKHLFNQAVLGVLEWFGKFRGWNEEIIARYRDILYKTVQVMTSRNVYPKRHWIRSDIETADGALKKMSAIKDHWFLSILESALSLRHSQEDTYVRRGIDGKAGLNFDGLREATKGIFDDDEKNPRLSWLKAVPWLAAGFLVGTPRWAAAVISIGVSRASQLYDEHVGLKYGLEESLTSLGVSPQPPSTHAATPRPQNQRKSTGQRRVKSKTLSIDSKLVPRYERCFTTKGVPYFVDHMNKSRSWEAPDQQEMCVRITNPPLSKRWEELQEDGRAIYLNRNTGKLSLTRPGPEEVWAVKKRQRPDWVKSTNMTLPSGWEMRRTEEGEMYYLDHNSEQPVSTTYHPMRKEIEDERLNLLPEWNVEWDSDRGKKYRNIPSGEIRWKSVNGPRHITATERAKGSRKSHERFTEPLPPGWTVTDTENGQKIYKNGKTGRERIERTTHPLTDKRRRLQSEWEMRYTPSRKVYWVHYGSDGRGTTWWKRNRILKNTSLKNNANGWKLAKNGQDWEWFEGGDIAHSEIPVLDLDDPAEIEFREYPFLLPKQIVTEEGAFIEPLPPNWVLRPQANGTVCYWNFKDEIRSEQHPNEHERENLSALWEMRFTRHGRQYFIHHEDGSTWWTHPREGKHTQQQRARPGQGQNGWKIAEDGHSWERFEERPDMDIAEESTDEISRTQSIESEMSQDRLPLETRRSMSFTRDLLRNVSSNDIVVNAMNRFPQTPKILRKFSDRSPSNKSVLAESPQQVDEKDAWPSYAPTMTGEPQSDEALNGETSLQDEDFQDPLAPVEELVNECKKMEKSPSMSSNLVDTPLEMVEEEMPVVEKASSEQESQTHERRRNEGITSSPEQHTKEERCLSTTEPVTGNPDMDEEVDTSSPRQKWSKKGWAKRTTSGLLAMKKNIEKKASERGFVLPNSSESAVHGLGITTDEPLNSELSPAVLPPSDSEKK